MMFSPDPTASEIQARPTEMLASRAAHAAFEGAQGQGQTFPGTANPTTDTPLGANEFQAILDY